VVFSQLIGLQEEEVRQCSANEWDWTKRKNCGSVVSVNEIGRRRDGQSIQVSEKFMGSLGFEETVAI
jgi:hypothetical protein